MTDHNNGAKDSNISSESQAENLSVNNQSQTQVSAPNDINNEDNKLVKNYKQISLRTKATVLAIAISTLPILGIGLLVNRFASNSENTKISQQQQTYTKGFANQINQLMLERYADIAIMANLPVLTNTNIRTSVTAQNQQAILDKFIDVYKVYDSIAVFDLNGDVITQSAGNPLPNHADRSYFQIVKETDRPYITQPMMSKSSGQNSVYIAAPVKDINSDETIAIIRARMPVTRLEGVIKSYASTANGREYHVIDDSGKIFLSSETKYIGKKLADEYQPLLNLGDGNQNRTFVIDKQNHSQPELVSYVPLPPLPELSNLQWKVVIATNQANAFTSQRKLLLTIAIGTGLTALAVGAIAAWLARRTTQPILQATAALAKIRQGDFSTRLQINREDELGVLGENINQMTSQLQLLLKERDLEVEKEQFVTDVTLLTRKILKKEEIFKTSVEQIRQALKTDRVIIYQFNPGDWDGEIVVESLAEGWPQMMGEQIYDPCFKEHHAESYKDGRVRAISNMYTELKMDNAQCYINMLEKYAVKAILIAPIITRGELMGLMTVHHCTSPRVWLQGEIDLFRQLVTQVGYALEQAQVLTKLEQAKEEEQQQKEELQNQLLVLLEDVEEAASGNLRVRAEITSGEIGIVADFFNSIIENLRLIVTQVQETAVQVNNSLLTNEVATQQLAESAIAQTTEINRVLDAVDGMTNSMETLASSTQEAATIANQAAIATQDSGEAMEMTVRNILSLRETVGDTTKKVKRLGESTQQITRVVSLINEIAMQTHLLAINAGIEAARAGEEGEGFAVVAEEVGILATRSSAATKEIEQIVENIQRETSDLVQAMELGVTQVVEGTQIVNNAKQSLQQIFAMSRQIDDLVQSVSTATTSQVQTAQTVSQLMREIAAISQESSESSRQVSASLQQTVEISQQLQATVGTFQVN